MKNMINNPFVVYGYEGPEFFCDRREETDRFINLVTNGNNIVVMSPRRLGKTGLIHHAFHMMRERDPEIACFYIDIFATKSLEQMVQLLAGAIVGKLDSKKQSIQRKLSTMFRSLRPTMNFDALDGTPTVSFDIVPEQSQATLSQIFKYIELSEKRCYLAIDEFQQTLSYPGPSADALIRSFTQFIPNLTLIFSGSQQHLLSAMFLSPKQPFFCIASFLSLKEIDEKEYLHFANGFFSKQKRSLSAEDFHELYSLVDGQTWFVQKILNRLYSLTGNIDNGSIITVVNQIIDEAEAGYQQICNLLTVNQLQLLIAIAAAGKVKSPTSGEFIKKYDLPSPSSIKLAIDTLVDRELVYRTTDNIYIVYDRFFNIWLKRNYYALHQR